MRLRNFVNTLVMLPGSLLLSAGAGKPLYPWMAGITPHARSRVADEPAGSGGLSTVSQETPLP